MSDYISREVIVSNIIAQMKASQSVECLVERILNLEAADVRPVVRAKWEFISFMTVKCSNCQETFHELEGDNFCPQCGADMREES